MPRTSQEGSPEFHPAELPKGYSLPAMDPDNSTIRAQKVLKKSIRKCKECGKEFELQGDYDPGNKAHDLCDDCLINLPPDPEQKYPESTLQIESDGGVSLMEDEP